mmetsp:Transcript_2064/g.7490  ORF Transcript_2064/g.7490 Transcript_2064/m.7490 type:complete len:232 (+) Transcript_2064:613-1308(+)
MRSVRHPELRHERIPNELVKDAVVLCNRVHSFREPLIEHLYNLGRRRSLTQSCEAPYVREHRRHLLALAPQSATVLQHLVRDSWGKVAVEGCLGTLVRRDVVDDEEAALVSPRVAGEREGSHCVVDGQYLAAKADIDVHALGSALLAQREVEVLHQLVVHVRVRARRVQPRAVGRRPHHVHIQPSPQLSLHRRVVNVDQLAGSGEGEHSRGNGSEDGREEDLGLLSAVVER